MATQDATLQGGLRGGIAGLRGRLGNPALVLLILAGASAFLLLYWGSKLTFLLDDWEFLIYRRGFDADAILLPHGEHIAVGPILVYKALLATFGMASALPFRVASTAVFLLSALLLFMFLARRLGQWPALAGTAVVLFLGPAWEDLLWPFQIGYFGSMASGLGMLLALERGDDRGDRLACALLTVSILFSSVGLPFAAGAAVHVLGSSDRLRRAYIFALPLVVYAAWWLGWGHTADTTLSLANAAKTPGYVLNGVASSLASALGLATPGVAAVTGGLDWGRPLAVAAIVLGAWRLHRLGRAPAQLWVVLAVGGAFWVLAGLNQAPDRDPTVSRYQYVGVVFLLLVTAELLRGTRPGTRAVIAVGVVAAAAIGSNVHYLDQAYRSYRHTSQLEKADLAAVEIARDTVEPDFVLSEDIADTVYVHVEAGPYLSASDDFGSPAYSPAELSESPEPARFAADKVLFSALRIEFSPVPAKQVPGDRPVDAEARGHAAVPARACRSVAPDDSGRTLLTLPRRGVLLRAIGGPIRNIRVRRFATDRFPIDFQRGLPSGGAAALPIPPDRAAMPWKAELETAGRVLACGRG